MKTQVPAPLVAKKRVRKQNSDERKTNAQNKRVTKCKKFLDLADQTVCVFVVFVARALAFFYSFLCTFDILDIFSKIRTLHLQ